MTQILNVLGKHGFIIMMSGFIISVAGLIFYMQTRYQGTSIPSIAFGITIAGFCIYVLGRVLVVIERKKQKKSQLDSDNATKESL